MNVKLTMTTTALVTTTLIIALGIYDLVVVVLGSESVSVSAFLVNVGFTSPMVVFSIGFICGHLFGYMKPVKSKD